MDLDRVAKFCALSGNGLNVEELSGLQSAIAQRKIDENLNGKMLFWGKVFGTTQDYLIVQHVDYNVEFPAKKYFYW